MAQHKNKIKTFEVKDSEKSTISKMPLTENPLFSDFIVTPSATKKSEGLGDTIEKVIRFTGLQHFVNGEDCGCEERKKKLNEMFPYRFKARCLTEQEYKEWGEFQKERTLTLSGQQVTYVCDLYANVFNRQKWYPCAGCVKEMIAMIDRLDKVYETYNK